MTSTEGDKERFGLLLRIAALVAAVLGLAAVIVPRLAFSEPGDTQTGGIVAPVVSGAPVLNPATPPSTSGTTATTTTTTTAAPGPLDPAAPADGGVADPSARPVPPVPPFPEIVIPVVEIDGGALELTLVGTYAGRYGPAATDFREGDAIAWRFRVTNTGDEYLWGVYVYLEGYGRVVCGQRRLPAGASTQCWAETTALAGANEADAWMTAWTELRMVVDRMSHVVVAGGA